MEADYLLRDYYEVWEFIGTELDIDRNVMNTIEDDHSRDRDRMHALVEVWLNGDPLTGTRLRDLKEALQSQHVVSAMAGMSDYGMLRNIAIWRNYMHNTSYQLNNGHYLGGFYVI